MIWSLISNNWKKVFENQSITESHVLLSEDLSTIFSIVDGFLIHLKKFTFESEYNITHHNLDTDIYGDVV